MIYCFEVFSCIKGLSIKNIPQPYDLFYSEDDLALRNKRSKKEEDYYKLESRSLDKGENGEGDRYKKRSGYTHDKHSKHEKPHRDELLKVCCYLISVTDYLLYLNDK